MVKKSTKHLKITRGYLENLKKGLKIKKAIVFGSVAANSVTRDSDIDLIVVSPDFRGKNFVERSLILSECRQGQAKKIAMDIIGYTPEEFKKVSRESAILSQALKESLVLEV